MPSSWTHWECDNCHKHFDSFDEAETCERGHIVDNVTDQFASDLKRILGSKKDG